MDYYRILAVLAVVFILIERIWPRVAGQRLFRQAWLTDAIYIIFNSKYAGMLLGYVTALWVQRIDGLVTVRSGMAQWPGWAQFAVLLVAVDFLKWCTHNLLHRVPALWAFHKVHHSIVEMDWIGDWRFHWVEIMVYNAALYLPGLYLGVRPDIGLAVGVFDTVIGHFAHANVRWRIGWLRYVINSPEMHLWHHNHPDCGPINRNFALSLAVWDWIFGTAYLPEKDPPRLGFDDVERYPKGLPGQWLAPFRELIAKR